MPSSPIVSFFRAPGVHRDRLAMGVVVAISLYAIVLLLVPVNATVRSAAMRRFHLSGWPFAAWVLFQPMPSMYNFENRWQVTFTSPPPGEAACAQSLDGFINHHIFHRLSIPAGRGRFGHCGPARVRFVSRYRGTVVETSYAVGRQAAGPGLIIRRGAP